MRKSRSDDLFATSTAAELERKWAALRKSEDPYAYYSIFGEEEVPYGSMAASRTAVAGAWVVNRLGISKKAFQDGCRRVFRQYVPPSEGQILRPLYRDFISRNEQRSPEARARLLAVLNQYDLSQSGDFKPHFNRESELMTAAKLRRIEATALQGFVAD